MKMEVYEDQQKLSSTTEAKWCTYCSECLEDYSKGVFLVSQIVHMTKDSPFAT